MLRSVPARVVLLGSVLLALACGTNDPVAESESSSPSEDGSSSSSESSSGEDPSESTTGEQESTSGAATSSSTSSSSSSSSSTTGDPATSGAQTGTTSSPGTDTGADDLADTGTGVVETDTGAEINPLAHLVPSAEEIGLRLANRFNQQQLSFNSVANLPGDGYKSACEWYGSLGVASLTANQPLLDALVSKFEPIRQNFVNDMLNGEAHVDRYIFGMVPLEIYLQTNDESYRALGTEVADAQQATNQTRDAIDDMFMMTGLQVQAYRATGDTQYLDFMAETMARYLQAQEGNGLFFHNVTQARVHWGRGNGWFAAGMAEIMRDLPSDHPNYGTIEAGYLAMMEGLLNYQGANGLWYQVLDMPNDPSNWEETSCSAMFTYAMVAGVRRGVLDADTYVPVIERAWAGLQGRTSPSGDVSDICVGTWYLSTPQEYMGLTRLTGDGHGQAPVLWVAAELLR